MPTTDYSSITSSRVMIRLENGEFLPLLPERPYDGTRTVADEVAEALRGLGERRPRMSYFAVQYDPELDADVVSIERPGVCYSVSPRWYVFVPHMGYDPRITEYPSRATADTAARRARRSCPKTEVFRSRSWCGGGDVHGIIEGRAA